MNQEFRLTHAIATVTKTSERAELKHPAGLLDKYLFFRVRVGGQVINTLLEDMSKFLYTEADQMDIDGENEGDLRYPELGALKIKHKMVGAKVTIHFGIGGSDMVFDSRQVDNFEIEAMQGGTFVLDFRAWIKPEFAQLDSLGRILGRECELSVEPATEAQGSLIDGSGDGDFPFAKESANSGTAPDADEGDGDADPFAGTDLARKQDD